jgi:hypothetical protein
MSAREWQLTIASAEGRDFLGVTLSAPAARKSEGQQGKNARFNVLAIEKSRNI